MSRSVILHPSPLPLAGVRTPSLDKNGYALFLLVNAVLFLRPSEIIPGMGGWPIYEILIALCALASLGPILRLLNPASLVRQPITFFVVALLPAVVLSHLSHGRTWEARMSALQFGKLVVYYLLLVVNLSTPGRLRHFLTILVILCMALTVTALLQFHGILDISTLAEVQQKEFDASTGDWSQLPRLVGAGIFHDPNDLCMLLIVAMIACVHGLQNTLKRNRRLAWSALIAIFAYAIVLTHSRGGFLSLLAAGLVLGIHKWGWRKTTLAVIIAMPILIFFGGRQTDLSLSDGTGQERLQIWSQGLALLRQNPVMGIGYATYTETVGLTAHNSFVQCFTELGLLGGTIFLGAFYCAIRPLCGGEISADAELRRLRPLLLAMLAAYAVGAMSLSRAYVVPTYMTLGLSAVFIRMSWPAMPRLSARLAGVVGIWSVCFIASLYVFVRLFVHWSAS